MSRSSGCARLQAPSSTPLRPQYFFSLPGMLVFHRENCPSDQHLSSEQYQNTRASAMIPSKSSDHNNQSLPAVLFPQPDTSYRYPYLPISQSFLAIIKGRGGELFSYKLGPL